jgi:hypothetical protein
MPPSQVLFHHRLFSGGGGVDNGPGFGDPLFQGLDCGDEFFLFVKGRTRQLANSSMVSHLSNVSMILPSRNRLEVTI